MAKCRYCGKQLNTSEALKVTVTKTLKDGSERKTSEYYCNEKEYSEMYIQREKAKTMNDYIYECCCYCFMQKEITNTLFWKEYNDIVKNFGLEYFFKYFKENSEKVAYSMRKLDGESEFQKIRYFRAVINNSMADYIKKEQSRSEVVIKAGKSQENVSMESNIKQRRSISDLEEDYDA